MKKILISLTAAAIAITTASCAGNTTVVNETNNNDKLVVYTSFYAMTDFVKEVGGDKVDVYTLCPVGSEPHDYEPTAAEIAKLSDADLFVYNGMGMEHWAEDLTSSLIESKVKIVNASENVTNVTEDYDPHIWLDPDNAFIEMDTILEALIEKDSQNSNYYKENIQKTEDKINKLKKDYNEAVADFSSRTIITSHRAYFAMCNAFNLNQMAVNGTDNEQEATPTHISEIETYIKANNVKYIFNEPLASSTVMDSIASDTGCGVLVLDPFEGSSDEKDYFTVMNENLETLKQALK